MHILFIYRYLFVWFKKKKFTIKLSERIKDINLGINKDIPLCIVIFPEISR